MVATLHNCWTCGALVFDQATHRQYHLRRGEAFDSRRVEATLPAQDLTVAAQDIESLLLGAAIIPGSVLATTAPQDLSVGASPIDFLELEDD